MQAHNTKILLTGLPGCGKTTAVMKILENVENVKAAGFYTEEIRENNIRKGFRWVRLDGSEGILAHVDIKSRQRVGKYGADVAEFERCVVPVLDVERTDVELYVIDEIGKMECMSVKFVSAVRELFNSEQTILATVAKKGGGFISEVKKVPKTELLYLTSQNRDEIISSVSGFLGHG
jgi:nucleoside-triphosphatase